MRKRGFNITELMEKLHEKGIPESLVELVDVRWTMDAKLPKCEKPLRKAAFQIVLLNEIN